MKLERLLAMTNYLLSKKRVTARTLAERFHISTRTVMRDIDTLTLAGIPVVTYYGTDGGYEILASFKLDRQLLGKNDRTYILTALQGLQSAFDHKELNNTLEKLQALSIDMDADMILDFSVLKENAGVNERLMLFKQAIGLQRRVHFVYTNASNEEKEQEIEPVVTMYKWYQWYLLGFHSLHQEYRMYKLVRMRDVVVTDKHNQIVHSIEEAKSRWEQAEHAQPMIRIRLHGKAAVKVKCEEYLSGKVTEEYENGDFLYECYLPEKEHFWYGTILALGSHIKVLEPPRLIDRICLQCKEILKQYEEV